MATYLKAEPVAVLPTGTDVTIETRAVRRLSVSVENLDVSQSIAGQVLASVWAGDEPGDIGSLALESIGPGQVKPADIDTGNYDSVTLRLTASGAGCNALVSARPDGGKR